MSLLTRKRVILAKLESSYGTDPTPANTDAILLRNLNFQPMQADIVSRDLIRSYLGNSEQLVATKYCQVDFEVELAGSGAIGVAPAYGSLLRAAGFAQAVNTVSVSSMTRSGSTATVNTASAHNVVVGDVIKIAGANESAYNGNQTVTAVVDSDTFEFTVSGSPSSPATGTITAGASTTYTPVSSSFESVTLYFNVDGVRHKMFGAFGNVEFTINARQIPVMKFTMTGLYDAPADSAIPSADYSSFIQPKVANNTNTPTFSLFSYSAVLENFNINMNNDINYRHLIGSEKVLILDRKPSGTFVFEAPAIATKDFFAAAVAGTTGALSFVHGTVGGQKVAFSAPAVSLQNPTYQDNNGVHMLSIPYVLVPSSGNDEIVLSVK